jgi:hypothetical protein
MLDRPNTALLPRQLLAARIWPAEGVISKSFIGPLAIAVGCIAMACGGKEDPNSFKKGTTMAELKAQSALIAVRQAQEEANASPPPLRVTAAKSEGPWPLTVDEAEIICAPGGRILLRVKDKLYAMNGTAQGSAAANGWSNVNTIWKFQKKDGLYRVSMGSLLGRAVHHCKI